MIAEFVYYLLGISSVNITTLLIFVTVCLFGYRFLSGKQFLPPLPPSPTFPLPVIGHLHRMDVDFRKVFRKYRRQLGDIYRLQLGTRVAIVISGYEPLKEAFVKQGESFTGRPSLYVTDQIIRNSGVILTCGPKWKEHRRFCLSKLKDFGMGKSSLVKKLHEEANSLVKEMATQCGKPFNPKTLISTHVTNIISSIVFKGQFKHDDPRLLKMIDIIDENLESTAIFGNFLPWLAHFPGDPIKFRKLKKNADAVFEYSFEIIAEHEKSFNENDIEDLTSAYIFEWKRLKDEKEPTTMSYVQLAAVIADLFIAGSHTTSTTIRWAIGCMILYPQIQAKLYKEVTNAIGTDKLPSLIDKTKLVYLEAFYLEVLRFCNLTIAAGLHSATHDLTFRGFTIPKDAIILPDLDSVQNDPEIWGDPDVFRPERFIDHSGNLLKKEENVLFFLGKRSCVGESLARMELLIFLGALVQNFKFESCPGTTLTMDQIDGVFGFVHGPKSFDVMVIKR